MFVKICGITNEADALLAVALGADALGFVFAPSKRQVSVPTVYDITRRLPPEIMTVGVFRDELPERVIDTVYRAGLKAAQLHGHETPAITIEVRRRVPFVIQAFPAGSSALDRAADHKADAVLVDSPTPGSGKVFDWTLVDQAPAGLRILLAGGLDSNNVAAAIRQVEPWGVDVSSGVEAEPGRKDARKLRTFIENARAAAPLASRESTGPSGDTGFYDWADEG